MRQELRPRLAPVGAWVLATGAAVGLSCFGVYTVLANTGYEPPRALPVKEPAPPAPEPSTPDTSSTHRPDSPASPSPTRSSTHSSAAPSSSPRPNGGERGTRSAGALDTPPPRTRSAPPPQTRPGGRTVPGGRAVFDLGEKSATLVSATPDAGWTMRVWESATWIRVTFTDGDSSSTVFCRWDDSAPRIETYAE